jgi:hypothetical protein
VLLSWLHWTPGVLAPSVAVLLLLVVGPQVVLLVSLGAVALLVALLAALRLLLVVGHLVAPVLGKLVVVGLTAIVALEVAFVTGPTGALLECFH